MSTQERLVYTSDEYDQLVNDLKTEGIEAISVTNGSFNFPVNTGDTEKNLKHTEINAQTPRTMIAGFQYIADHALQQAPDVKRAFVVAVHGRVSMERDYNVDPATIMPESDRAQIFMPQMRQHFEPQNINIQSAVFNEISAVALEHALHEAGFKLEYAFKFGPWGSAPNKFSTFHEGFKQVFNYPYSDPNKKPFMFNQGPWDGTGTDPRDQFRHQDGVAFYHVAPDTDPQTKVLEVVDLFSDQNPYGKAYLTADQYPAFPLQGGLTFDKA